MKNLILSVVNRDNGNLFLSGYSFEREEYILYEINRYAKAIKSLSIQKNALDVVHYLRDMYLLCFGDESIGTFFSSGGGSLTYDVPKELQTWFYNEVPNDNWIDIAYGNEYFIAISDNGHILVSNNGRFWDYQQITELIDLNSVSFGSNVFVISAKNSTNDTAIIAYGKNASDLRFSSLNVPINIQDVHYGQGLFLAIGYLEHGLRFKSYLFDQVSLANHQMSSMSGDYAILIDNAEGAVVYVRDNDNNWSDSYSIINSDNVSDFYSCDISGDYILIGFSYSKIAYVYQRTAYNTWGDEFRIDLNTIYPQLISCTGVSVSIDGKYLVLGLYNPAFTAESTHIHAIVFEQIIDNVNIWGNPFFIYAEDSIGSQNISISKNNILISNGSFGAYFYRKGNLNFWSFANHISADTFSEESLVGEYSCLSGDVAVIGTSISSEGIGSCYIYEWSTNDNSWNQEATISFDSLSGSGPVKIYGDYVIANLSMYQKQYDGTWSIFFALNDNWDESPLIKGDAGSLIINNQIFYIDSRHNSFFSTNGKDWQGQKMPFWGGTKIIYGNNTWIVLSPEGYITKGYYYRNSFIWEDVIRPYLNRGFWEDITFGSGMFVAVSSNSGGESSSIMYSDDGDNWTILSSPVNGHWKKIIYGDGKFFIVGSQANGVCLLSLNGRDWSSFNMIDDVWNCLLYFDNNFLAISQNKSALLIEAPEKIHALTTNKYGIVYCLDDEISRLYSFEYLLNEYANDFIISIRWSFNLVDCGVIPNSSGKILFRYSDEVLIYYDKQRVIMLTEVDGSVVLLENTVNYGNEFLIASDSYRADQLKFLWRQKESYLIDVEMFSSSTTSSSSLSNSSVSSFDFISSSSSSSLDSSSSSSSSSIDSSSSFSFESSSTDSSSVSLDVEVFAPDELDSDDLFGNSVSIDKLHLIVGASGTNNRKGRVYIYSNDTLNYQLVDRQEPHDFDYFGCSVSIDGNYAVAGAYGTSQNGFFTGSAEIINLNSNGMWQIVQTIEGSDSKSSSNFGFSVGISGEFIIVGAYGDNNYKGSVYIYKYNHTMNSWDQFQKVTSANHSNFGFSVSISNEYFCVGAPDLNGYGGYFAIYKYNGNIWVEDFSYYSDEIDKFGWSVSIYSDLSGFQISDAIVGSQTPQGKVFVFRKMHMTNDNWNFYPELSLSDNSSNDNYYGHSVAVTHSVDASNVYFFVGSNFSSRNQLSFVDVNSHLELPPIRIFSYLGENSDQFGYAVAACNEYFVIASPRSDYNGFNSGRVYRQNISPTLIEV